jgi:hypothetical protein
MRADTLGELDKEGFALDRTFLPVEETERLVGAAAELDEVQARCFETNSYLL